MYCFNRKNVKKSVNILEKELDLLNIKVPHTKLLQIFSKIMFQKNWNTLNANLDNMKNQNSNILTDIPVEKYYIIQFSSPNLSHKEFLSLFMNNCKTMDCVIENIHERVVDKVLEVKFGNPLNTQKMSNLLTVLMLTAQELKERNAIIDTFEWFSYQTEKTNLKEVIEKNYY